ncbi:TPA: hypothetical protein DEP34_01195 [Candidatus Uhrbacteria bacterium]|uniref:Uncharacterized protein n=2 Tax=Candidatus Uhriibacteriota TaxID=1752732 RepID=A0A0G1Q5G1_9BACT|nr:MAG: hypothetical protein UX45_C0035G0006 [Candidatus Uhrbacteria bacterium GW2011_GWF2_46_218]KKU40174.1 MAG: hypothetical protein UX57_C0023G0006 [Candidatus Uhrbacteria bacterium GW2011_GWE2_46_68]HBK34224.1 hypothetical protein [Candidatus Uhrbacteria bacterium]HCB18987.1 hypothetical protein [Candidatus Uhrbacteria bacterium]
MSILEQPVPRCSAFPLSLRDLPGCITCTLREKTGFDYEVYVQNGMPVILHDHERDEDGNLMAEDPRIALRDCCPKTRRAFENNCIAVSEIKGGGYRVETPARLDDVNLFAIDLETQLQTLRIEVTVNVSRMNRDDVILSVKAMKDRMSPSAERMLRVLQIADIQKIGDIPTRAMVWNQQGEDEVLLRVPIRCFLQSPC